MKDSISKLGAALVALGAAACGRVDARVVEGRSMLIDSIGSPAAPGGTEPNLVADERGRVYMSWLEPVDTGFALRVAALDGRRWSTPQTVRAGKDFFINWADFPSIEVLDGGRLAVHWLQRVGSATYAYGVRIAQSRDGGRSWSIPIVPHDSSPTEHGFVAMWRESGKLGVVWLDGRKFSKDGHDARNEMMLVTNTVSADGSLGGEVRLDERTCDCCQNAAAVTSSGPIVAYRNRSAEEIRDIYVSRRIQGKWTTGTAVHADNWKIAACPVNGPAVAARGNDVVVAWFTGAGDTARVRVAFSRDAGATFGAPIQIDGGSPAGRVDAALLGDGDAIVTWIERTGGEGAAVMARRVRRTRAVGPAMTVATSSAARASGFPRMAVSGSDIVFAWTVPGRPSSIRVARAAVASIR